MMMGFENPIIPKTEWGRTTRLMTEKEASKMTQKREGRHASTVFGQAISFYQMVSNHVFIIFLVGCFYEICTIPMFLSSKYHQQFPFV